MSAPITLVCGFGRCGSSLVMQMLWAGGADCTGAWPDFEIGLANRFDGAELAKMHGRVVKLLTVHDPAWKFPAGSWRSIWLERDSRQQAQSHAKFLRHQTGMAMSRRDRRAFGSSFPADEREARRKLQALGPVLRLSFEDILADPHWCALHLAAFCGLADVEAMAAMVLPRSPKAMPDMAIEESLIRAGPPRRRAAA